MTSSILETRRAEDIMRTEVVSATPEMTVRELVQLLADEAVSGVPVLDAAGNIRGVVSTTDVVRMAASDAEIPAGELRWVPDRRGHGDLGDDLTEEEDRAEFAGGPADEEQWGADLVGEWGEERSPYYFTPDTPVWFTGTAAPASQAALDDITVEDIMTPVAYTVPADETLAGLIRFFLQGRIHRALVVEGERLLGIVTPFDVMRGVLDDPEVSES